MVKVKEFAIKLDNEKDNYFAGETLSGKVVLNLSDRVPILKLGMLIEGIAISNSEVALHLCCFLNICAPL